MATSVLTFVIVGQTDHPIYEVDLTGPKEVSHKWQCMRAIYACCMMPFLAVMLYLYYLSKLLALPMHSCSNKHSISINLSCIRPWTRSMT